MTEELYLLLLERSKLFCRFVPVDYRDFLHDVICEEHMAVDEGNVGKLFNAKERKLRKEPIYIHIGGDIPDSGNTILPFLTERIPTWYKWCYGCDDFYPSSEFYTTNSTGGLTKLCKRCDMKAIHKKYYKAKPVRTDVQPNKGKEELSDNYIINNVLYKTYKREEITPELIEETRQRIEKKRARKPKNILYSP